MTAVKREKMIKKRQRTSERRRKDSHRYRYTRSEKLSMRIIVVQNAGEFKKTKEIVLRTRTV
jgi:hypothetical protein